MKTNFNIIFLFACFGCPMVALAQDAGNNYTVVYSARVPLAGDLSNVNDRYKVATTVTYYDGLGREIQSVIKKGSTAGFDIVSVSAYNQYGKKTKSYLPYTARDSTGQYKSDALIEQRAFLETLFGIGDGASGFSDQLLEESELSRVLASSSPGEAWKLDGVHVIRKEHITNGPGDVLSFNYNDVTGEVYLKEDRYYLANTLTCNKTTDESGNDVLEYSDREGRVVCKKVTASAGVYACTYYVYDVYGNLAVVLPPEGVKAMVDE